LPPYATVTQSQCLSEAGLKCGLQHCLRPAKVRLDGRTIVKARRAECSCDGLDAGGIVERVERVCTSAGSSCDSTYVANVSGETINRLTLSQATGACAPLTIHVIVDGVELKAVGPLGWIGATGDCERAPCETLPLAAPAVDQPVPPGSHQLTLSAEGAAGGC